MEIFTKRSIILKRVHVSINFEQFLGKYLGGKAMAVFQSLRPAAEGGGEQGYKDLFNLGGSSEFPISGHGELMPTMG